MTGIKRTVDCGNGTLHIATGKVVDEHEEVKQYETTRTETDENGRRSSHTTTHTRRLNRIVLVSPDGAEKHFTISSFEFSVRPTNQVSVFWHIEDGKDEGLFVAVYNHTTDSLFLKDMAIAENGTAGCAIIAWPLVVAVLISGAISLFLDITGMDGGLLGAALLFFLPIAYLVSFVRKIRRHKANNAAIVECVRAQVR